nr:WXG100 family type VII secretion target [Microbacterium hydrocarbonoxydans]
MAVLKAEPAMITALAAEIVAGSEEISAALGRLQAAADDLSHRWSGEAQQAYAAAQGRWTTSMTELAATAKAAGELADEWSTGLRDLERSLAQGWPG